MLFLCTGKLPNTHQAKPKKRKLDPENLSNRDVWQTRRKKGRLVVRNLPFKVEYFQCYVH